MDPVHEKQCICMDPIHGPWAKSTERVHGPGTMFCTFQSGMPCYESRQKHLVKTARDEFIRN